MSETVASDKLTLDELNYVQEEVRMKGKKLTLSYILLILLGNLGIHLGYLERTKLALMRAFLTILIIAAFYPIRSAVILAETNGITIELQQYSSTLFVLHMLLIVISLVWLMYDLVALPSMVKKFNNKLEVEAREKAFTARNVESMLRKDETSRRMIELISEELSGQVDEKASAIQAEIDSVHKDLHEHLIDKNEATNDLIENFTEKIKEIETLSAQFNEETEDIKSSTNEELNNVKIQVENKLEDIKAFLDKKILLTKENTDMKLETSLAEQNESVEKLETSLAEQSESIEDLKIALQANLESKDYDSKETIIEKPVEDSTLAGQLEAKELIDKNNNIEFVEPEVEEESELENKDIEDESAREILEGELIEKPVESKEEEPSKESEVIEIEDVSETKDEDLILIEDEPKGADVDNSESVEDELTQEDIDEPVNNKEVTESVEKVTKSEEVESIDTKKDNNSKYSLIDEVNGTSESIKIKERSETFDDEPIDKKPEGSLTVTQALEKGKGDNKVTGYIVGYMDPNKHDIVFEDFDGDLNVVIADSSDEKDTSKMITIQLTWDSKLRDDVGLLSNPVNLHKEITVDGQLMNYFKGIGIKQVSSVRFTDTGKEFFTRD